MKKILFLALVMSGFNTKAQSKTEDASRIVLTAVVPEQIEGLTPPAQANLKTKLNQIITKNGMGGTAVNPRFIITANVVVLTKDITATAPPMQSYTLGVTLYIGDGIEGTLFSSTSVNLKGVGETETKAYMAALKNLKTDDPKYQAFLETGKTKIIDYYKTKCDFILKDAESLSTRGEFEVAIAKLVSVPDVCKECYDKAMAAVVPIYQKQIDKQCKVLLAEAQAAWNAAQDMTAAEKAGSILAKVDPGASCFADVKALSKKIETKVKEIGDREWKYILKEQAQESERIEATRAVGVAYGNNQPATVYNYSSWW